MNFRDRWWFPCLLTLVILGAWEDYGTDNNERSAVYMTGAVVILSMYRKGAKP